MTDEARHGALGTIETQVTLCLASALWAHNVRGKDKEKQRKHDK